MDGSDGVVLSDACFAMSKISISLDVEQIDVAHQDMEYVARVGEHVRGSAAKPQTVMHVWHLSHLSDGCHNSPTHCFLSALV